MKNILVAFNFEKKAGVLIKTASKLAEKFNSKIWLIHIAAPPPDFVGENVGPQYIRDFRAKDLRKEHKTIQRYAAALQKKGIKADGLLVQGATIQTILGESLKLKADMIIIGQHEHGFLHRLFTEDTSAGIIHKSKIPILVVPLGKSEE